jgi:hypothetical protein
MTDRLACCIAGCTNTMGHDTARKRFGGIPAEWICAAHWSRISRDERRIWARFKRQTRVAGSPMRPEADQRIWEALKRRAAA